jgi:sigma-B regulation protein RsbU (phosphoserine phosphatase)
VLGVFEEAEFVNSESSYESGDSLVLFTDGIIEAVNPSGEEFGLARLCEATADCLGQPAQEMLAKLIVHAKTFVGCGGFADDICLIGIDLV